MPGSPCLSKKRIKCMLRFFWKFFIGSYGQRIPDPVSCRCPEPRVGLLETQPRWHATVYLPPALAEEVIFSVAFVCLCVCLCSAEWTVEPTDLNLTHTFRTFLSQTGLKVKVKVQMSRSHKSKCKNSSFQPSIRNCGPRSRSQRSGQMSSS